MPQLPPGLIAERAARLREAGRAATARFLASQVGAEASLLVERDGAGHTEHFAPARLARGTARPGEIVSVRITGADETGLIAERALAEAA
jgi:threonylcarbamoyladenosine tRNA methylthiotransferase MtaB